jgi:nucleoside-diphosphate-sugar epimerase
VVGLLGSAAAAEIFARLRGRPFIFNLDKAREALAGHWICSTRTIRHDLGFAPRLAFADRLRQTADWYRQHNWL